MNIQINQENNKDQTVYVGLDVSTKQWDICIMIGGCASKLKVIEPKASVLSGYLRRHYPGCRYLCAYEAGYHGFVAYRAITQEGIECIVVHPADVPTMDKERVIKTDRVDARKLARCLAAGMLRGIHVPSQEEEHARALVRLRQTIVGDQTQCKNRIKALIADLGITLPPDMATRHWSKRFVECLQGTCLSYATGTQTLRNQLAQLVFLRDHLADVTRQIHQLGAQDQYRESLALILSIPGFGIVSAMIFLTEIGDIRRFPTESALASYVGLVPGEHSSGGEEHRGSITHRQCNAVRTIMIEVAWRAVMDEPELQQKYAAYKTTMKAQKAIVKIARKLLRRTRHILLQRVPYRTM
jgi:transposase